jgi:LmbE family N-acetylglucosaminyl deacetylase
MNVAVIAPHPDDESIGCGGVICQHRARGDDVFVVYLTSGELGLKSLPREEAWKIREEEARQAAKVLGIGATFFLRGPDWSAGDDQERLSQELSRLLVRHAPAVIYLPHLAEWHPDHKASLPIVRSALASSRIPDPVLWGYEVWTPLVELDRVENITAEMPQKLRAVRCHQSQLRDLAYDQAVDGLNRFRGITQARCQYAEVFQSFSPKPSP